MVPSETIYSKNLSGMIRSREMEREDSPPTGAGPARTTAFRGSQQREQPPAPGAPAPPGQDGARGRAEPAGGGALAPPPTARSLGFTISSLGYAVAARFAQTLAPLGLEPREFALMRAVSAAQGQTQQAIAGAMHVPASRMVALIDTLEARGLVERRHNPRDRRARELHLTAAGAELLTEALGRAGAFERALSDGLSDAEREQLLEMLQRVGGTLGVPAGVHAAATDGAAGAAWPVRA
jgi:DNA-binding MarR family transcriptional regulator